VAAPQKNLPHDKAGITRVVNETRMRAAWKLGRLLAKIMRQQGGSKPRPEILKGLLDKLDLNKNRVSSGNFIGSSYQNTLCLV
jgi:hypothetical protein